MPSYNPDEQDQNQPVKPAFRPPANPAASLGVSTRGNRDAASTSAPYSGPRLDDITGRATQQDRAQARQQRQDDADYESAIERSNDAAAIAANAKRKEDLARKEAEFRTQGVKFYTDATGDLVPERDERGQVRFNEDDLGFHKDAKSGTWARLRRGPDGRTTATPAKARRSKEDTDPYLYADLGEKGPQDERIGHADELAKISDEDAKRSPHLAQIRDLARANIADRTKIARSQALAPILETKRALDEQEATARLRMGELEQSATAVLEEINRLDSDPAIKETTGGFLGMGAKPTDRALQLQTARAEAQRRLEALTGEQSTLQASLSPEGELGTKKARVTAELDLAKAQQDGPDIAADIERRKTWLQTQGKDEDSDEYLQRLYQAEEKIGATLSTEGQLRKQARAEARAEAKRVKEAIGTPEGIAARSKAIGDAARAHQEDADDFDAQAESLNKELKALENNPTSVTPEKRAELKGRVANLTIRQARINARAHILMGSSQAVTAESEAKNQAFLELGATAGKAQDTKAHRQRLMTDYGNEGNIASEIPAPKALKPGTEDYNAAAAYAFAQAKDRGEIAAEGKRILKSLGNPDAKTLPFVGFPGGGVELHPDLVSGVKKDVPDIETVLRKAASDGFIRQESVKPLVAEYQMQRFANEQRTIDEVILNHMPALRNWASSQGLQLQATNPAKPEVSMGASRGSGAAPVDSRILLTDQALRDAAAQFLRSDDRQAANYVNDVMQAAGGIPFRIGADVATAAGELTGLDSLRDFGIDVRKMFGTRADIRDIGTNYDTIISGIASAGEFLVPASASAKGAKALTASMSVARAAQVETLAARFPTAAKLIAGSEAAASKQAASILAGAAARGTTIATGAVMTQAQMFTEMREMGIDPTAKQQWAVVAASIPLGASELLPIERLVKGISNGAIRTKIRGSVAKALIRGGRQFLADTAEETMQEVGQEILTDLAAKAIYDARRQVGENIWDAALGGAAGGAFMSAVATAIGGARFRSTLQRQNRQMLRLETEGAVLDQIDAEWSNPASTMQLMDRLRESGLPVTSGEEIHRARSFMAGAQTTRATQAAREAFTQAQAALEAVQANPNSTGTEELQARQQVLVARHVLTQAQAASVTHNTFALAALREIDSMPEASGRLMPRGTLPANVAAITDQNRNAARALLRIALGSASTPETFTESETLALQNVGARMGTSMVRYEEGQPVITDTARSWMQEVAPQAAAAIRQSEVERLTQIQAQATDSAPTQVEGDRAAPDATGREAGPSPAPAAAQETPAEQPDSRVLGQMAYTDDLGVERSMDVPAGATLSTGEPVRTRTQAEEWVAENVERGMVRNMKWQPAPKPAAAPTTPTTAPKQAATTTTALPKRTDPTYRQPITDAKQGVAAIKAQANIYSSILGEVDTVNDSTSRMPVGVDSKTGRMFINSAEIAQEIANGSLTPERVENLVRHEAIHAVALKLENDGKLAPAGLFRALAPATQQAIRDAYGKGRAVTEAYLRNDRSMGHEGIRMFVEGRLTIARDGKLTLDGAAISDEVVPPTLRKRLADVFRRIRDYLANFRDELLKDGNKPEVVDQLNSTIDLIAERIAAVEETTLPGQSQPAATGTTATPTTRTNETQGQGQEGQGNALLNQQPPPSTSSPAPAPAQTAPDAPVAGRAADTVEVPAPSGDQVGVAISYDRNVGTLTPESRTAVAAAYTGGNAAAVGRAEKVIHKGKQATVVYAVRELEELRPSNRPDGTVNTDYPADYQPRNRQDAAYIAQQRRMAQNWNMEEFALSGTTDRGTPILAQDPATGRPFTMIGNGRAISLQMVLTEQDFAASRERYMGALPDLAQAKGIDPATLSQFRNPVLVRVIASPLTPDELREISRESNEFAGQQTNAVEQAAVDADRLKLDTLAFFDRAYALDAQQNLEFRQRALEDIVGRNANLTPAEGTRRIGLAIFLKAYANNPAGKAAFQRLVEEKDEGVSAIQAGLMEAAPNFLTFRDSVQRGDLHPVDASDEIAQAVQDIVTAIANKPKAESINDALEKLLQQPGMEAILGPREAADIILQAFIRRRRSSQRIADYVNAYVASAYSRGDPKQVDWLNDLHPPTKVQLAIHADMATTPKGEALGAAPAASAQTETPEFKRWFGNSKVVDAQGKPLMVYHGTTADFAEFKQTPASDFGFHFGTTRAANSILRKGKTPTSRAIMPVFLRITNPLRLQDEGTWQPFLIRNQLRSLGLIDEARARQSWTIQDTAQALEDLGYDGIVYSNFLEDTGADSWIAWRPTQIKSATGNSGAFDPANPSILGAAPARIPNTERPTNLRESFALARIGGFGIFNQDNGQWATFAETGNSSSELRDYHWANTAYKTAQRMVEYLTGAIEGNWRVAQFPTVLGGYDYGEVARIRRTPADRAQAAQTPAQITPASPTTRRRFTGPFVTLAEGWYRVPHQYRPELPADRQGIGLMDEVSRLWLSWNDVHGDRDIGQSVSNWAMWDRDSALRALQEARRRNPEARIIPVLFPQMDGSLQVERPGPYNPATMQIYPARPELEAEAARAAAPASKTPVPAAPQPAQPAPAPAANTAPRDPLAFNPYLDTRYEIMRRNGWARVNRANRPMTDTPQAGWTIFNETTDEYVTNSQMGESGSAIWNDWAVHIDSLPQAKDALARVLKMRDELEKDLPPEDRTDLAIVALPHATHGDYPSDLDESVYGPTHPRAGQPVIPPTAPEWILWLNRHRPDIARLAWFHTENARATHDADGLNTAFNWGRTPEGDAFWGTINAVVERQPDRRRASDIANLPIPTGAQTATPAATPNRQTPATPAPVGRPIAVAAPAPKPAPAAPTNTPEELARYERLGRFFTAVAANDEVFQGPTPKTDPRLNSKDLADIAAAYSTPEIKLQASSMASQTHKITIKRGAETGYITFSVHQDNGQSIVSVGATEADSASNESGGGKQAYQAIFTWAHNNGHKVRGSSLSTINQVRRTVNMLANALRHKATAHLIPYSTQGLNQTKWDGMTDIQRIGYIAETLSEKMSERTNFKLDRLTYDPVSDSVIDTRRGTILTAAELKSLIGAPEIMAYGAGFGAGSVRLVLATRAQILAFNKADRLPSKAKSSRYAGGLLKGVLAAAPAVSARRDGPSTQPSAARAASDRVPSSERWLSQRQGELQEIRLTRGLTTPEAQELERIERQLGQVFFDFANTVSTEDIAAKTPTVSDMFPPAIPLGANNAEKVAAYQPSIEQLLLRFQDVENASQVAQQALVTAVRADADRPIEEVRAALIKARPAAFDAQATFQALLDELPDRPRDMIVRHAAGQGFDQIGAAYSMPANRAHQLTKSALGLIAARNKARNKDARGPARGAFTPDRSRPQQLTLLPDGAILTGQGTFDLGAAPIIAHHGTPHRIDRFSTAKIGTGEGAQAYGWGLYFAEERQVADAYRRNLAGNLLEFEGRGIRKTSDAPQQFVERAIESLRKNQAHAEFMAGMPRYVETLMKEALEGFAGDARRQVDTHESMKYHLTGMKARLRDLNIPDATFAKLDKAMTYVRDATSYRSGVYGDLMDRLELRINPVDRENLTRAESTALAEISGSTYWLNPKKFTPEQALQLLKDDAQKTIDAQRSNYELARKMGSESEMTEALDRQARAEMQLALLNKGVLFIERIDGGNFYTVEIMADADEDMLHWDRDHRSQPPRVREAIKKMKAELNQDWQDEMFNATNAELDELTGEEVYRALVRYSSELSLPGAGPNEDGSDNKMEASAYLQRHGIKGIRYADGFSRSKPDQKTHNYVIFDDTLVRILERNGEPVTQSNQGQALGAAPAAPRSQPVSLPDAIIGSTLGTARNSKDYLAAKSGDRLAALRITRELVTSDLLARIRAKIGDAKPIVLGVHAEEQWGRNTIPDIAALRIAEQLGVVHDKSIVQSNRPRRSNASALDRVFSRVEFDGPVQQGADYLLVDDTLTQGGTFADLADYIQRGGGKVVAVVALTGKQYSAKLRLSDELLRQLRAAFGNLEPQFTRGTGYGFERLTESEARALVAFRPADAVRDRILEEGQAGSSGLGAGAYPQGPLGAAPAAPNTPQFKSWFAGSKVVDANGAPLVVYHGGSFNPAEDPVPFINGNGFHFGTRGAAQERSGQKAMDDAIAETPVYPENGRFFVDEEMFNSRPPEDGFETEEEARGWIAQNIGEVQPPDEDPTITAAYLSIRNPMRVTDQGTDWTRAITAAKRKGHDGLIYTNHYEDMGSTSYVAFEAGQIKSATDNDGSFSRYNDSVLGAAPSSPEFRQWFGKSKVVTARGNPRIVYHGTAADEFDTFRPSQQGTFGPGIYFAFDREIAVFWAEASGIDTDSEDSQRIIPAYVRIENPAPADLAGEIEARHGSGTANELARLGYDGVIDTEEIMALRPEQVKHAKRNSGAFDRNNPSMLGAAPAPDTRIDLTPYRQRNGSYRMDGLHRGIANAGPNDHGVAGKGPYFSFSERAARLYARPDGRVITGTITLRKPLILTYGQLNDLQTKLFGKPLSGFEPELSDAMDQWMRDSGYDGAMLYDLEISTTVPEEVVKLRPFGMGATSASLQALRRWSSDYATFEAWNDQTLKTPGRVIAEAARKRPYNYRLELVPVASLRPSQQGEDALNDSSRETARRIAAGTVVEARPEDIAPIVLEEDGVSIRDGNHRHAAATINGDKEILALVPTGPGNGQIENLEQIHDLLTRRGTLGAAPSDDDSSLFDDQDSLKADSPRRQQMRIADQAAARVAAQQRALPVVDTLPSEEEQSVVEFASRAGRYRIPKFMGAKSAIIPKALHLLRRLFSQEQLDAVKTVVEGFGGSGSYGQILTLERFKKATSLIIVEFEAGRKEKIQYFHTRGHLWWQDYNRTGMRTVVENIVRENVQQQRSFFGANAVENMELDPDGDVEKDPATSAGGVTGRMRNALTRSQTLAAVIKKYNTPEMRAQHDGINIAEALAWSLIDYGSGDRASGLFGTNDQGKRRSAWAPDAFGNELEASDLYANLNRDILAARRQHTLLKDRGVKVEWVQGSAFDLIAAERLPLGPSSFFVADPPYYHTTGYKNAGAFATGNLWNARGYAAVVDMLERAKATGTPILYNDEGWALNKSANAADKKLPDRDQGERLWSRVTELFPSMFGSKVSDRLETIAIHNPTPIPDNGLGNLSGRDARADGKHRKGGRPSQEADAGVGRTDVRPQDRTALERGVGEGDGGTGRSSQAPTPATAGSGGLTPPPPSTPAAPGSPEGADDAVRQDLDALAKDRGLDLAQVEAIYEQAALEPSGSQTSGNPELANPGTTRGVRRVVDSVDEYRRNRMERESHEMWTREAERILAADETAVLRDLLAQARSGVSGQTPLTIRIDNPALSPAAQAVAGSAVAVKAAQLLVDRLTRRAIDSNDQQAMRDAMTLAYAYRIQGTEQARALAARRDPFKTPEQRYREFLAGLIFTPSITIRNQVAKAWTPLEKAREINRIQAQVTATERQLEAAQVRANQATQAADLARTRANEAERAAAATPAPAPAPSADVQKLEQQLANLRNELGQARMRQSQQDMIVRASEQRLANLKRILAQTGVTVEDILGGEAVFQVRGAAVIGNVANNQNWDATRKRVAKLANAGWDLAEIIKRTKLTKAQVEQIHEQNRNDIKERLRRMSPAMLRKLTTSAGQTDLGALGAAPADENAAIPDDQRDEMIEQILRDMHMGDRLDDPMRSARTKRAKAQKKARTKAAKDMAPENPADPAAVPPDPNDWLLTEDEDSMPPVFDKSDPAQVHELARIAAGMDSDGFDMAHEFWINSILSGPLTQAANISGNALNVAWSMGLKRTLLNAANDVVLPMRSKNHRKDVAQAWASDQQLSDKIAATLPHLAEFRHMLRAVIPSIATAWSNSAYSFATEQSRFAETILEPQTLLNFDGFDDRERRQATPDRVLGVGTYGGRSLPGAVVALLMGKGWTGVSVGKTVRLPGRFLMATDDFFKTVIAHLEAAAHAYRIAKSEGLSGQALERRIGGLVRLPGSAAWISAYETAQELTFQKDFAPTGGLGRIQQTAYAARRIPGVRYLIPFVRTPLNIFVQGIRQSPFGAIMLVGRYMQAGYLKARYGQEITTTLPTDEQASRAVEQFIAWSLAGLLYAAAAGDDDDEDKPLLITGALPRTSEAQRSLAQRAGMAPYSIRIAGKTMSYGRLEPLATIIGTTVDMITSVKHGSKVLKTPPIAALDGLVQSITRQGENKTMLKGAADFFQVIQRSTQQGIGDASEEWLADFASSWVPNLLRQPARMLDDTVRAPAGSLGERIAQNMVPTTGAPSIDVYGREVKKGANAAWRLAIPVDVRDNPALQRVDRMLVNWNQKADPDSELDSQRPWAPSKIQSTITVNGRRRRITAQEREAYARRAGAIASGLLQRVPLNVENPTEADVAKVKRAFEAARKTARREVFGATAAD